MQSSKTNSRSLYLSSTYHSLKRGDDGPIVLFGNVIDPSMSINIDREKKHPKLIKATFSMLVFLNENYSGYSTS